MNPTTDPARGDRSLTRPVLAWAAAAALLLVLFARVGGEIGEGETAGFDGHLVQTAQALRAVYPWMSPVMRDLSGVGSTVVLTLVTVGACGYLLLTRPWRMAFVMAASVLSAAGSVQLLKTAFARPRPEPAWSEYAATGLSFPSGHTSMSGVVLLMLGALIARARPLAPERTYIVTTSALLVVLLGISRAALGVHWATDVVGCWAFGTA